MEGNDRFDLLFKNFTTGVVDQLKVLTTKVEAQTENRREDREEIFQRIADLRTDINSSVGKLQISIATMKKELETSTRDRSVVVSGIVSVVVGFVIFALTHIFK